MFCDIQIHHGGGVYPPAILNRRHRGDGGRGEHRWYRRAARMPRPQVTFVHLHAHSNPHQGYPLDNTYSTRPNNRLALAYEQPRNDMQMLEYWVLKSAFYCQFPFFTKVPRIFDYLWRAATVNTKKKKRNQTKKNHACSTESRPSLM